MRWPVVGSFTYWSSHCPAPVRRTSLTGSLKARASFRAVTMVTVTSPLSISPCGPGLHRGSNEPQTGNLLGGITMPLDRVDPKEHDPFSPRRRYKAHAPKNPGTCSEGG